MDFLSIIKTVAPWIGTALTGPLGGMAIGAAAEALGLSDKSEAAIKAALGGATPEQMLMLKQADQAFAEHMQSLGFSNLQALEKIAADDRASARDREVRTGDTWTPRLLAAIVVIGYILVQWYVLGHIVAPEMRDIVLRSMGTLDMALGMVLGYYYGTTAGSRAKDSIIAGKG